MYRRLSVDAWSWIVMTTKQQKEYLLDNSILGKTNLDITQQQNPEAAAPQKPQQIKGVVKVGRNDPCPCGSGKKFKQCHGKEEGA